MTPAARIQTAIEILERIETASRPADQVVTAELRARRYVGSKDRRAINALVFALLRHRARLDWWIAGTGDFGESLPAERPRLRAIAWHVLDPDRGSLETLFDGSGYGPAGLTDAERQLAEALRGRSLSAMEPPAAVRAELPSWLYDLLAPSLAAQGGDADAELAALNVEAPLDLRVNTLKSDRETARAALAAEGIEALPTPWSPLGLRVAGRRALPTLRAFRDGLVEVQDEASQLAALLVAAEPAMVVADLCAGGGGKALALAACMADRGELIALDRDARRLERARPRLGRAGVANCELVALSGGDDAWLSAHARAFDRVLVDAPCSGSGAWRRNPDARWRFTPEALAELRETQAGLLDRAAALVRPGGRLVYATCSLIAEENGAQLEAFLARTADFTPRPYGPIWRAVIGSEPPGDTASLTLTPARHGTDGFFIAVLERSA